jgi:hypothetical protein
MNERGDMNFQVNALNDLRDQFVLALEADAVAPAQAARPRSFEWRRAWAAPAIALAVAIIVAGIYAVPWSKNPTVAEATAGVAKTALAADYPPDDWFTYSRSENLQQNLTATPDHRATYVNFAREAWLSVTRRGSVRSTIIGGRTSPPIIYRYPAYGKYRIGEKTYTRREIDAFAAHPQELLDEIDAEASNVAHAAGDWQKWTILTEALRDLSPPLPATLRAALIGDLASVHGVVVAEADHDPLGRAAVGLVFADQDTRNTVWFDKSSSALSYSVTVVTKIDGHRGSDVKVGDILERFELLESKATPTAPKF